MITRESVRGVFPVRPLAEVSEFLDSRRKPVKESERKPGPYPYYGANGQQGSIDGYLFDEPLILLAEDGGFFDQPDRGIAYRVSGKTWVNNHAHVIRPRHGMDLAFLCRVLENYNVLPFISGSTRAKLTKGQAEKIEIPVPPLEEQKRIAAILDQADELRRKRQRAIDRLNELGQAIFHEMFGGATNYASVSLKSLGKVSTGSTPPTSDASSFGGTVPFITPGDLGSGQDVKRTLTESGAAKSRLVAAGATFICCIGATIGKMDQAADRSAFNQQINAVEWSDQIDPTFGFFAIQQIRDVIIHKGKGASTTLPILKKSEFEKLEVIVPPLNEQRLFATRIKKVRENQVGMLNHSVTLEALFTSLQHRAFQGEL